MPFAEDSTLASKILAGTRGSAGALTEQVRLVQGNASAVHLPDWA